MGPFEKREILPRLDTRQDLWAISIFATDYLVSWRDFIDPSIPPMPTTPNVPPRGPTASLSEEVFSLEWTDLTTLTHM